MDVVYFVKPGDDNDELRYSLRSLKNIPHGEVWVIGYKPNWVKDVNYLPLTVCVPDRVRHRKWWASWKMMQGCCANDELPDDFLFFNDDFFVMKPVDSLPVYHRGNIAEIVRSSKHRTGKRTTNSIRAMEETLTLLKALEKPLKSYELHIPMTINRHKMLTAMEVAEALREPGMRYINKRSLYGNYWEIGGRRTNDVKVATPHRFPRNITFLSSSDKSFRWNGSRGIRQFIEQVFPSPSPYETT